MADKAIFIDRDGTLMVDYGYIRNPDQVELLPGVKQSLDILLESGFRLFLVTNQSGIGRGMMTVEDVEKVNDKLFSVLGKNYFTDVLICPHDPDEGCDCRKPATGLVTKAAKKFGIDLSKSYSIGDRDCDRELGFNFGGSGLKLGEDGIETLLDAANLITGKH